MRMVNSSSASLVDTERGPDHGGPWEIGRGLLVCLLPGLFVTYRSDERLWGISADRGHQRALRRDTPAGI